MEIKKNPQFDLENYKQSFLGIGFIISLLFIYIIIEWKTYDKVIADFGEGMAYEEDEEAIHTQQETPPPPPPPPSAPEQIMIVDNEGELEVEMELESEEFNEYDVVDIEEFEQDVDIPLTLVENKPIFPGCEKLKKEEQLGCMNRKIFEHVRKEFRYPEIAKEMGIQGKVYVKFIINKKGKIDKVSVMRGVDKNLDKEAVRVVDKMKDKFTFIPARQGDRAVNVSYALPITFKLQ